MFITANVKEQLVELHIRLAEMLKRQDVFSMAEKVYSLPKNTFLNKKTVQPTPFTLSMFALLLKNYILFFINFTFV